MHLRISQVAQLVGLSPKRIQDYEKEGFIKPVRSETGNQRMYGSFEIGRIIQVKRLIHERGFTIAGIKALLNLAPCWTIFDCRNARECPVYQSPNIRCWKVRQRKNLGITCSNCCDMSTISPDCCNICPVYRTQAEEIPPLFPEAEADSNLGNAVGKLTF